ncbi:LrgA family protein [Syntrophobotulus glycolicus DSM 8271]|uniref:LrgA family protein n=1 Tax=Syntrophobotulus glycolicus (strain DSM 8271 / FlGlyR) TaxID=645991 RepID=F0T0F8_SYNGF|nr:CidA/LrgA family holin-like protein [Syntrophobotulus glycolicus]ADY57330.1 LrgA family protein [Syntrophobotulus glycolicus DSM 8271]
MKALWSGTTSHRMKEIMIGIIQIAVLYLFVLAGNDLAHLFHLDFPGSLIGLALLFLLLHFNIVPCKWVMIGGNWLLTELILFFIPSVVAVIQYQDILQKIGIDLFFIILIGTITVMISSGLTAELMMHHKVKKLLMQSRMKRGKM